MDVVTRKEQVRRSSKVAYRRDLDHPVQVCYSSERACKRELKEKKGCALRNLGESSKGQNPQLIMQVERRLTSESKSAAVVVVAFLEE
jgi:hypothetical protein